MRPRRPRPAAFVGGIVKTPTPNISATNGLTGTVFYPATIFLGRGWDGRSARCGGWSQPAGWRTIGHEWAHYALGYGPARVWLPLITR
jgi:hypothetical protein